MKNIFLVLIFKKMKQLHSPFGEFDVGAGVFDGSGVGFDFLLVWLGGFVALLLMLVVPRSLLLFELAGWLWVL